MLCPVCKNECGTDLICARCGFDQVQVDFLSEDEAILWINNVVAPYRDKWQSRQKATSTDFEQNLLRGKPTTSFQDELKQNLRSPETVRKENAEKESNARMTEATLTLHKIKRELVQSAKNARYTMQDGVATVTCFCDLPQRFLRIRREDNIDQIKQDKQRLAIFRDPNLIYRSWNCYEVEPKFSNEFTQYIAALRQVAAVENIRVECVVYSSRENKMIPFPSKVENDYSFGWHLCVHASMAVSSGSSSTTSQARPIATYTPKPPVCEVKPVNKEPPPEQSSQESHGAVIGKSLLVIGLCVGAFALCFSGEMGQLGMAVLLIGAAIGGYFILKK